MGTVSLTSNQSTLEYIPGIGLVCRGFLTLKDTRLSHYSVAGGSFEEERPATGTPRVYRLVQYSTTAGIAWTAESTFNLPQNPSVVFSFIPIDSPPDWDATTYPPFIRIEFGNGLWALQFSKIYGNHLLKLISGVWTPVMELPEPDSQRDIDEVFVTLRCHRGKIAVSTDLGKTYQVYEEPLTTLTVAASRYLWRGQGGMSVLGLHQILYATGIYTSPARGKVDLHAAGPTITGLYSLPTGTSIVFADVGSNSVYFRYTATLTPTTTAGTPFTFYTSPELYAVQCLHTGTASAAIGIFSQPFDGSITSLTIDKSSIELQESTATLTVRKDPDQDFLWSYGRWPKCLILPGEVADDGVTGTLTAAFFGYVESVSISESEHRGGEIRLTVQNAAFRFKRAKWTPADRRPLGGQTVNQALDEVLQSEGLNASYRSWHSLGDQVLLPFGLPEDPFEWPKDGEAKWDTLRRVAAYAGLEILPTDGGLFVTLPIGYVSPVVDFEWNALPSTNLRQLVRAIDFALDCGESATAIFISGRSEADTQLVGTAIDLTAETNVFSPRFCPWREAVVDAADGTCSIGVLNLKAAGLAPELFDLKFEAQIQAPVHLALSRRMRVRVHNTSVGITSFDTFVILGLTHTYQADPSFARCATVATVRRLN